MASQHTFVHHPADQSDHPKIASIASQMSELGGAMYARRMSSRLAQVAV